MIDHMTLHAKNIDKTKKFYSSVLKPLGYKLNSDDVYSGTRYVSFSADGKADTWFTNARPASGPGHMAWSAKTRKAVDDFYKAALKAGAKDNGAPGLREDYSKNYYAAFVIDPDGNNIEAVCTKRAKS
jgi:catechol 2,3-dioxygenase-like lactoylglutathione lyase family enzyme